MSIGHKEFPLGSMADVQQGEIKKIKEG